MAQLTIYDQLGRSLEWHTIDGGTLVEWLQHAVPNYADLPVPPYSAELNSMPWPYVCHGEYQLQSDDVVAITLRAREGFTLYLVIASVLVSAYSYYQVGQITSGYQNSTPDGDSGYNINVRANRARLNGLIPEVAGSFPRFPDLLTSLRRTHEDNKEVLYLMYSLGAGRFNSATEHVYISETAITQYNDDATVSFYAPGADVSGDEAAQNWLTSPEIGGNASGGGLALKYASEASDIYDLVETEIITYNDSGDPISSEYAVDDVIYIPEGWNDFGGHYQVISKSVTSPYGMTVARLLTPTFNDIDPDWEGFSPPGFEGATDIPINLVQVPPAVKGPWSNYYQVGFSDLPVLDVEVDYVLPRGLWGLSGSGSHTTTNALHFEIFLSYDGGSESQTIILQEKDQSVLRYSYRFNLSAPVTNAQIRFRRLTAEAGKQVGQDLDIVRVKARLPQANSYNDVTAMTLRLVGSNTLAASGENKINLRGDQRMLPTLANLQDHLENDTALEYTATKSIPRFAAWTLYDMLGSAAATAINWDRFNEMETYWAGRGDELNGQFTDETTLWEALGIMFGAGMAEPIPQEGAVSIVRNDALSTSDVAEQHLYTPDIMLDEGVRWGDSWYNSAEPDGIDVEYIDPDTAVPNTVECRLAGDEGLRPKRVQLNGVTDRTQAWRIGMRERRRLRYKPAQIEFSTELDALNNRPGDAIAIASDLDADQYGVVTAVSGDMVTTNLALEWTDGETHYAAFRKPNGRVSGLYEVQAGGTSKQMQLISPAALDFTPVLDNSIEPMLFSMGVDSSWAVPAIVREISPSGLAEGKPKVAVTAEEFLAEIYADDDNTPPD